MRKLSPSAEPSGSRRDEAGFGLMSLCTRTHHVKTAVRVLIFFTQNPAERQCLLKSGFGRNSKVYTTMIQRPRAAHFQRQGQEKLISLQALPLPLTGLSPPRDVIGDKLCRPSHGHRIVSSCIINRQCGTHNNKTTKKWITLLYFCDHSGYWPRPALYCPVLFSPIT